MNDETTGNCEEQATTVNADAKRVLLGNAIVYLEYAFICGVPIGWYGGRRVTSGGRREAAAPAAGGFPALARKNVREQEQTGNN